mgnify:CR=1 FL=1
MILSREQSFDYKNPDPVIAHYKELTDSRQRVTFRMYQVVGDPPNIALLRSLKEREPQTPEELFVNAYRIIQRASDLTLDIFTYPGRLRMLCGIDVFMEEEGVYFLADKGRLLTSIFDGRMPSAYSG